MRAPAILRALWACRSGVSVIEFALMLPILMTVGMYGVEIAWMTAQNMEVSQVAMSVADSAARMEQTSNSGVSPTVTETDVNSVLSGGVLEAGSLAIATKGRVIISSLEIKPSTTSTSYIHWQRCTGGLTNASFYGVEGATTTGMGAGANKITAQASTAVMFVEIYYQHTGLFGNLFIKPMMFHQEAAFLTRDDRNITAGLSGTKTAGC